MAEVDTTLVNLMGVKLRTQLLLKTLDKKLLTYLTLLIVLFPTHGSDMNNQNVKYMFVHTLMKPAVRGLVIIPGYSNRSSNRGILTCDPVI